LKMTPSAKPCANKSASVQPSSDAASSSSSRPSSAVIGVTRRFWKSPAEGWPDGGATKVRAVWQPAGASSHIDGWPERGRSVAVATMKFIPADAARAIRWWPPTHDKPMPGRF
jgi:hypothetical protein